MKIVSTILFWAGMSFLGLGILLFIVIYYQVIQNEISYAFRHSSGHEQVAIAAVAPNAIHPVDEQFGIVIPKIGANAKVIAAVNPYDSRVYQWALTKGIAQASGTALPPNTGNMFLFSHSSANFYDAARYNSVFYLLSKLESGDKLYVFYQKKKYTYTVSGKKIVDASDVQYLSNGGTGKTVTLMTCWPAGTSFKRLLVFGSQTGVE